MRCKNIYTKKFIFLFLLFIVGCSPLETLRVFGIGIKPFREQGKVYSQIFNKDYPSSYEQTLKALEGMGAFLYRGSRKKHFIVAIHFRKVFKQSSEATEVAVFFKELEDDRIQVEVASLNYPLAELVAAKLFEELKAS